MLDDLLGRGFTSKVKSLIKVTKTRIEAVRKKRNATHKFLKKDIAHLLANGLDINAFGRAEGLVTELLVSSCYDFVEHCCDCVLKNLSALHKKREFSEDCKVAVASLMFAAARFSDLPELRDLRQIFLSRYGNSFDHYINQKFVKNLSANPASMESKLQLMQDIAFQHSVVWNAKAFEQRMSMSPISKQKEHLDNGSFYGADNGIKTANNYKMEAANCTSLRGLFDKPDQDSKENAHSRNGATNERSFDDILSSNVNKAPKNNEDVNVRRVESVYPLFGGKTVTETVDHNSSKFSSHRGIEVSDARESHNHRNFRGIEVRHMIESHIVVTGGHKTVETAKNSTPQRLFHKEPESCSTGEQKLSSETESLYIGSLVSSNQKQKNILIRGQVQAGDEAKIKHFHPPPYVKPSKVVKDTVDLEPNDAKNIEDSITTQVSDVDHLRIKSGRSHDGIQSKFENLKYDKSSNGHVKPPKASKHVPVSESAHTLSENGIGGHLDAIDHLRSRSGQITRHESETHVERTMKHYRSDASTDHDDKVRLILPKPRSTRRRSTRSSSNDSHIEGSDKCDEKRTVSRTSNRRKRRESRRIKHRTPVDADIPIKDEDKILDNLLIHYSSKPSNLDTVEDAMKKSGESQVTTPFPPRSVSLPREQSVPLQARKVFTRATTFQLDRAAQHVHPKLPDYDDLAARFSGMKANF